MKSYRHMAVTLASFLVIGASLTIPSQATSLKLMNIEDIVRHSERIFTGVCLTEFNGLDETNLPCTIYSFRATSVIHGDIDDVVVIKQFGLKRPIEMGNGLRNVTQVPGMPQYVPGQEYLLFLNNESSLGFCAPIGFYQSLFLVQGKGTRRTVINGFNNANLFMDTSKPMEQRYRARLENINKGRQPMLADEVVRGPLSYNLFIDQVERLVAGERLDIEAANKLFGQEVTAR